MTVVWSITNCEYTNDSDKGVVHAAWSATDTDGDYSGTVSGMESYTPDPSDSGYVAWDSLDESTVTCLLYTSPSPRDGLLSRMPSSA